MERLGNNQEKKPERTIERIKRLGAKFVEAYIESHRHGDYYISAGPHGGFFALTAEAIQDEKLERLFDPTEDDGDNIVRGEE